MDQFVYFGFFLSVTFLGFLLCVVLRKKHLTEMQLTMSSMSIGMLNGLMIGFILGVQMKGNLYVSSLWGIGISSVVGFIFGMPLSLLCVVESVLAGVMGSLMGTMLGDMITYEQIIMLLRLIVLIYISILLILMKMIFPSNESRRIGSIHNPIVIVLVYLLVFISIQFTLKTPQIAITIKASEYMYDPLRIEVRSGTSIRITLENIGDVEHDIQFFSITTTAPNDARHSNHSGENSSHLHVFPGENKSTTIFFDKAGTYSFFCSIPGHKENGMVGTLLVK